MKKLSLLTATLLSMWTASTVNAADVRIYGLMDESIAYVNTNGQSSQLRLDSGSLYASRFGLKGSETLSGTTSIFFKLEAGIDASTGENIQGGSGGSNLFGRESVLGISTEYGTFAFGRMGTLTSGTGSYELVSFYDSMGTGFLDAGYYSTIVGTIRASNAVTYVSPNLGGLTVSAQYSLSLDKPEAAPMSQNNRYAALGASYSNGPLSFAIVGETELKASSQESQDYRSVLAGVKYDFGTFALYGAAQWGENYVGSTYADGYFGQYSDGSWTDVDKSTAGALGISIPMYGGTFMTSVQYMHGKTLSRGDGSRTVGGVAYLYPLSKNTNLYGAYAYSNAGGALSSSSLTRSTVLIGMNYIFL